MDTWFLVKINWPQMSKEYIEKYIGLGGDIWPELSSDNYDFLKKVKDSRTYVVLDDIYIYVVKDYMLANEYAHILKENKLIPILISVTSADNIEADNISGYDFGNPEGSYSIIETEILVKNRVDLIEYFLNENLLFKSKALMNEFIASLEDAEDVEELSSYSGVAIKQILV